MATDPAILARLDAALAGARATVEALVELRAELAAGENFAPAEAEPPEPVEAIDTITAAERFGVTSRYARKLAEEGCGQKVGGRWMVDPREMRLRLRR